MPSRKKNKKGKPRVLLLGKLPPPFIGPAIATLILLNSTLKEKFDLLHLNTTLNTKLRYMGKWGIAKAFRLMMQYFRLLYYAACKQPDLVLIPISQTSMGFFKDSLFLLLSRITGRKKILLQLRGSHFKHWVDNTSGIMQTYVKYTLKQSSGVIVLGEMLRPIFKDYFPPQQIHVIPNGGDFPIPSRKEVHNTPLQLLYISNFLPSKGLFEILQALSIIRDADSAGFQFKAMGAWNDPAYRKKCESYVSRHGLPVQFISHTENQEKKYALLAASEVFIFTPVAPEGHPWVIIEALAAGLPVIATAQGAITQSVLHGINGFIVPAGNAEKIAESILKLVEQPELRRHMGEQSKQLYRKEFTEQVMISRMEKVFKTVMAD